MIKLKTLTDIEEDADVGCESHIAGVASYVLRQEAIKYIKELSKLLDDKEMQSPISWTSIQNRAKIEWIKHFFNITEEELK
jgi:hypothetical protein